MEQIFAAIIFIAMFILIITEKWERHIVTLVSAVLTIVFVFGLCMRSVPAIIETLNVHSIFHWSFGIIPVQQQKHPAVLTGKPLFSLWV